MAGDPDSHIVDLETLARQQFPEPPLSEAEHRLLLAAPKGETAMGGPNFDDKDKHNDPAKAAEWGNERAIRAELIRWLCVDREAINRIDPRGVLVYAAKISGSLDLSYVTVPFPLRLARCSLTEDSDLSYATIPALYMDGSSTQSLNVDGAHVKGNVYFNDGFSAKGQVRLAGIEIGDTLDCSGGRFKNPTGMALNADGAKVAGYVFLRYGFLAEGEVHLLNAEVGRSLECTGSTFKNPQGRALYADKCKVTGSVFLREGFLAEGEVNLRSAQIGSQVDCSRSTFKNPGGAALLADWLQVTGSVYLSEKFSAEGRLQLIGARIGSDLDFSESTFNNGEVNLVNARIGNDLDCSGSTFKNPSGMAINADGIKVTGDVFLRSRFSAEGEVSLLGAELGRSLNCSGGTFKNPMGKALHADKCKVSSSVFLREGFLAEGEVDLTSAQIGSQVDCSSSTFKNPSGAALLANWLQVTGSVFLSENSSAEGSVQLKSARIGSDLDCSGSRFNNGEVNLVNAQIGNDLDCSGSTFKNPSGKTLDADGAKVTGSVFLRKGFSAQGEVSLIGAEIGRSLECQGGGFKDAKGKAFTAAGVHVSGFVNLGEGLGVEGEMDLRNSQIAADLDCGGGKFDTLLLSNATVKGTLGWHDIKNCARLDLGNASAGMLWDDQPSWPDRGHLLLDGFVYERISKGPRGAKERLEWIDRQDYFTPQPYQQLAKVLREMGDDGGAKQALFVLEKRTREEERRRLVYAARWFKASNNTLSDLTVGYGIYPGQAIWYLCGLTALGWLVHRRAQRVGAMAPTDKDAYADFHKGETRLRCQPFSPLIYSLENCIPLVKFGQDESWQPDPNPQLREPEVAKGKLRRILDSALDFVVRDWAVSPEALRWFRWIMIGLGWLLATFFVAGLTGIIKAG